MKHFRVSEMPECCQAAARKRKNPTERTSYVCSECGERWSFRCPWLWLAHQGEGK
jgi:hypothetical protein